MEEKKIYSVQDCAKLLGVSLPVMYQICKRSTFPAVRISERRIVIPADSLAHWLHEQAGGSIG